MNQRKIQSNYLLVWCLFFWALVLSGCKEKRLEVININLSKEALASYSVVLPDPRNYFRITVIDEETGRGIPMVKLTTLTGVDYYTDSAGVVAFFEPELMNQEVFFYIESHGYSIERDAFNIKGKSLKVVPGDSAVVKMKCENIARRLYRITGTGIYHDSVLLGDKVPISNPLINAGVAGQDSTQVTIYKDKLFWLWGDTTHLRYPLAANFKVTCATSKLPADGGLDPEIGVELNYFKEGEFVKQMVALPGPGPYWLSSLVAVKDKAGKERLVANYAKIKPPMETIGRGMVEFNNEKGVFEEIRQDPLDSVIQPNGHPFKVRDNGVEYFYFFVDGVCRTRANYESVVNRATYEAFTCLKEGSKFNGTGGQLDRAQDGTLHYSWKKNTSPICPKEQEQLIKAGLIKPEEKWFQLIDVATGKEIIAHAGSIYWNPYRQRWVMIISEAFGTSMLGEIWYAEGDTPLGPWVYAQKIVTHNKYSFYNPVQHPHFAKDNGRIIFFEGTYTMTFSGNEIPTPRYDYNQIMYKLELDDKRLFLPVPIYKVGGKYLTGDKMPESAMEGELMFFAPDRPREGTIPIYEIQDEKTGAIILTAKTTAPSFARKAKIAFYALSAETNSPPPMTLPLYEFIHAQTQTRLYSLNASPPNSNYNLTKKPLCLVWRNPTKFNPYKIH